MATTDSAREPSGKRTSRATRRSRGRVAAALVEHLPLGIFVLTAAGRPPRELVVTGVNRAAQDLAGLPAEDLLGRKVTSLFGSSSSELSAPSAPAATSGVEEHLLRALRSREPLTLDGITLRTPGLEDRTYAMRAFRAGRRTVGVSIEDVTDEMVAAAALQHRALHDPLTGLPNRALFRDRLHQSLLESHRTGGSVALLLLDLNQFKDVNDRLGHQHGDRLLVAVASRLRDSLRECDTVARLGGDEFALLLTDGSGVAGARAVAQKIVDCVQDPFVIEGMKISVHTSVGIAVYPDHGDDVETLIRRADAAMYSAKRSGGGAALHDREHERASVQRMSLASDLERAIESGELRLAYQPILDVATRRIDRVEALVRWQHPNLGLLPPKEFVDLAMLSGVIRPLTNWVIDRSLAQVSDWRNMGVALGVSVNLAAHNLFELDLPAVIAGKLSALQLPGEVLTVEISESELLDDPHAALAITDQMRPFGVRTSIDDFGTGTSSLTTLHDLTVDEIKIDSSFVAKVDESDASRSVVRSIADIGRNLGVAVVAEGVHSNDALAIVAQLGCGLAQGYHIGPPMSAGAVALVAAATQEPTRPTIDIRDTST